MIQFKLGSDDLMFCCMMMDGYRPLHRLPVFCKVALMKKQMENHEINGSVSKQV